MPKMNFIKERESEGEREKNLNCELNDSTKTLYILKTVMQMAITWTFVILYRLL